MERFVDYFDKFLIICTVCKSGSNVISVRPITVQHNDNVTADSIEIHCDNCGNIEYFIDPQ